jgi:hypothetical protein
LISFPFQDFVLKKKDYLASQVGNPEGADKPNKKVTEDGFSICCYAEIDCDSSMTHVYGCERAKRHSPNVSRLHARTLVTLTVCRVLNRGNEKK